MSLVSVIIPIYNAAQFLANAVDSVLKQTFRDIEVLAIDDGSTDRSPSILAEFAASDPRVRVISQRNAGIVNALEAGRSIARGEFIARMDADDWALPDRFARQLDAMRSDPSLVALGSSVTFMDATGNAVEICHRPIDPTAVRSALLAGDGGVLIHPAVMFRAETVAAVGGYRRSAQYVEDLDLYLRLDSVGLLGNLPERLLNYRVHPKSINFTKNEGREKVRLAVMREAYAVRGLHFDPARFSDNASGFADLRRLHRKWAVTALACGPRRVAVGHGCRAVRLAPFDREAWKALRYALTAPRPIPPSNS